MRNAFLTCALLFAGAAFADDPVVMTVGDEDVRLSEVRYHYRKNREILAEPVAPDKYLDMFVLFKMKVADARSEGLDTAASFRNEMAIHRRRLAEPFVSDTTMLRRKIISRLEEKHGAALNADGVLALREWVAMTGIDSLFFAGAGRAPLSELEIARIGSEGLTVADFLREGALSFGRGPADGLDILSSALEEFYFRKLVEAEEEWLYANDPDFRNLLDEYRDGTLMFEISSRRVWNHPRDEQARLEKRWQRDLKRKYPVRFRIKNLSKLISSAG